MRETGRSDIVRASREISDVAVRLADMDAAGVAVQVIYPTLFLVQVTDDPGDELAIPGRDFGFARLIDAQAAGDFTALEQRGRPIVRINLEEVAS